MRIIFTIAVMHKEFRTRDGMADISPKDCHRVQIREFCSEKPSEAKVATGKRERQPSNFSRGNVVKRLRFKTESMSKG